LRGELFDILFRLLPETGIQGAAFEEHEGGRGVDEVGIAFKVTGGLFGLSVRGVGAPVQGHEFSQGHLEDLQLILEDQGQ
jgi:hypothetical protein